MALTEKRIIKQITILPDTGTINVQWAGQILRDGAVVSEQYHRKAYGKDQMTEFVNEVENGQAYLPIVGWSLGE
jgi:hypothetical protein